MDAEELHTMKHDLLQDMLERRLVPSRRATPESS